MKFRRGVSLDRTTRVGALYTGAFVQFHRVSPTQILIAAPVEWAREAAWHSLWQSGVYLPVIDAQRNLVSGSTGDGILVSARTARARLEARPEGTLVEFSSAPLFGGTLDFGVGRKQAQKMADALQRIAAADAPWTPEAAPAPAPAVAPIASPVASVSPQQAPFVPAARPLYGPVLAPKRGIVLLVYSLLTSVICAVITPINLVYGFKALKDYREQGDPGDKALVIAAMVISGLVSLLVVSLLALAFGGTLR